MEDKRIKLITKEMFIAWALICAGFFILDSYWWNTGLISMATCRTTSPVTFIGAVVILIIVYTNLPGIFFSAIIMDALSPPTHAPSMGSPFWEILCILLFVSFQIVMYWYLGKLVGDFIVGEKHSKSQSKFPEPPPDK